MESFINFNGKVLKNDKPIIYADNHSFRYGDGCFETLKILNGKIILEAYHWERLFISLQILQFNKPNFFISHQFRDEIIELSKKNKHKKAARVRITIARGNGGLYDVENHFPNYVIQTWDLNSMNNNFNENGLIVDFYWQAKKSYDTFSHLKTNNFLCYTMAALWAKENKLNDAIILNTSNRVADSTLANIFIVENNIIKTPPLSEGCISGVLRKYLLKSLKENNIPFEEKPLTIEDVLQASEVFFTNSVYGIRWVKEIRNTKYNFTISKQLHNKFIVPLYF